MSYVIVYDKVFVATPSGYTVMILQGDSETEDCYGHWACWSLGLSEDKTMEKLNWTGDELFKYRGKWVNTESFRRFLKNGIKSAKTIEEIYAQSKLHPHCKLEIWNHSNSGDSSEYHTSDLETYAASTEEFECWVGAVKERIAKRKSTENVNPVVGFDYSRPLVLPKTPDKKKLTKEVLAKCGKKSYVYNTTGGAWYSSGCSIFKAKMFPDLETAKSELTDRRDITFIDAESAFEDYYATKYCLKVTLDALSRYFVKLTAKSLMTTCSISNATLFSLLNAEKKMASITERYKEDVDAGRLTVEIAEGEPRSY